MADDIEITGTSVLFRVGDRTRIVTFHSEPPTGKEAEAFVAGYRLAYADAVSAMRKFNGVLADG